MAFRAAYPICFPIGPVVVAFFFSFLLGTSLLPTGAAAQTAVFRVNAGGVSHDALDGGIAWERDTSGSSSPFHNSGSNIAGFTGGSLDGSVPASTPAAIFDTERYDPAGGEEMAWIFPVGSPGTYEVRLFFKNGYSGTQNVGDRVFNVLVEGDYVLNNYDIVADVGHQVGVMKSFTVTSDANLNIDFERVIESPLVNGIEIVAVATEGYLLAVPAAFNFGVVEVGLPVTLSLTLKNLGAATDIMVDPFAIATDFQASFAGGTLTPGTEVVIPVTFDPAAANGFTVEYLDVSHDGGNSPVTLPLRGNSYDQGAAPISFNGFTLAAGISNNPTSLQFGPDGRLYVGEQDGLIQIYEIARTNNAGEISYSVTDTETLNLVQTIPNHNDDGTDEPGVNIRLVTGLMVVGTAANPVLFVTSSDPRYGVNNDVGLDTNSGIISRLTWTGSAWDHVQIVRGLPRSEEIHASNGMDLDPVSNILYLIQGGNTNKGAPSNNFSGSPEYALSAALLAVDLDVIEAMPIQIDGNGDQYIYDLPTIDDPTRVGNPDLGDPFGGNNGLNQARWDPAGPVQVYASGFRNAYDVLLTASGRLYTFDNGPNGGWGGLPLGEGTPDVTNEANETGDVGYGDQMHFISGPGYYGGHPNPTRANPAGSGLYIYEKIAGTWTLTETYDWLTDFPEPPVPVSLANPTEANYVGPPADGSMFTVSASTNGLCEYTASNFGGQMTGQILAASFNGNVIRFELNAAGDAVIANFNLGNIGTPLDVIAQGDADIFPGTVWSANHGPNTLTIYEPIDYEGGGSNCTGADDAGLDEDNDGFNNADEIDNGTDPCASGSFPTDADGDLVSDLNDDDDDNDGLTDELDPFSIDAANGLATPLPVDYTFSINSGDLIPDTFFNLGFTGLMSNGTTDYLDLFDPGQLAAGGASGFFTVENVPPGDAFQSANNQEFAFQFGLDVDSSSPPFMVHTRLAPPFFGGVAPVDNQAFGLQLGTGDQDNYFKVVFTANGSLGGVQVLMETAGAATGTTYGPGVTGDLLGAGTVDLYAFVDPALLMIQARVSSDGGTTLVDLGAPVAMPADWLSAADDRGLAAGLMATSSGSGVPFNATWDLIEAKVTTSDAAAALTVTAGAGINASTYSNNSFLLSNNSASGQKITCAVIDLGTGMIEDMVFDPDGTAGDLTAKPFTVNANPGVGTISHTLSVPHGNGGYDVLTIDFAGGEFDPGETLGFSIDADPTSIEGVNAPGPGEAGSVSGLELVGATITVEFDDGSTHTANLYSDGSLGGSAAVMDQTVAPAPEIEMLGLNPPVTVGTAERTVRITGPAGAVARLLIVEAALFEQLGGGVDLQPFEANSAIARQEFTNIVLDGSGSADVPVTLTRTDPDGGLNHLVAVLDQPSVATSAALVVEYDPSQVEPGSPVLYRVNNGGPLLGSADGSSPHWAEDSAAEPSPFRTAGGEGLYDLTAGDAHPGTVDVSEPTLPTSVPAALFATERNDPVAAPEMAWEFPVASPAAVEVRLYLAEIFGGVNDSGERVFDVLVEGEVPTDFTTLDPVEMGAGPMGAAWVAVTQVVTDGSLSLEFVHGVQDPAIKGIEVIDVTNEVSAVDEGTRIPERFALLGAYPNPFNPSTTIAFELPLSTTVRLGIYDLQGRLVRRLVDGALPAGRHDIVWDGRDRGGRTVGSGIYLYRFLAGDLQETRKIMLVK